MNQQSLLRRVNIHHALLQGLYWGSYAAIYSYVSVYLLFHGFNNFEVGIVTAAALVLMILINPFLSAAIDRSKRLSSRHATLGLVIIGFLSLIGLWLTRDLHYLTGLFYILIGVVLQMIGPYINSMIMALEVGGLSVNFGIGRAIGSTGFATTSFLVGLFLETHSIDGTIFIAMGCFVVLFLVVFTFRYEVPTEIAPQKQDAPEEVPLNNRQLLKQYPVFMFLMIAIAFIMAGHFTNGAYIVHITNKVGMGESGMGLSIAICAYVEIPAMVFINKLYKRFGPWRLLCVSAIAFSVKSALYIFATAPWMIYTASALQCLGFGLTTPLMVIFIAHYLRKADLVKGQGLYGVFSACVGPAVAEILCGQILDLWGIQAMLYTTTALSLIGTVMVLLLVAYVKKSEKNA